jgi:hypothetical protein
MSYVKGISYGNIQIHIDADAAIKALEGLGEKAMEAAFSRAVRKVSVWMKSQVAKSIGHATGIPQKMLRRRLKNFYLDKKHSKIWLGLNAIDVRDLANSEPRNGRRGGVYVGKFHFPHAFLWKGREDEGLPVFERNGIFRAMSKGYYKGKTREAIQRAVYDFKVTGKGAMQDAAAKTYDRFLVILRQEVSYELQKALGNAR